MELALRSRRSITLVQQYVSVSLFPSTIELNYPQVIPNSQIYFYQFTSPAANTTLWTTRFTLADASGASTPPTEATQPGTGEAIPWGTGALANPADAKPAPAGAPAAGAGNTTAPANSTITTSAALAATPAAGSLPPAAGAPEGSPSTTSTSSTGLLAAATPTGASANQSSGAGVIIVDDKIWKAVIALVAAAVTFSVAV